MPLADTPSFITNLLKSQWDPGRQQQTQHRGGWVVLSRRILDPWLAAPAGQVEWPSLFGATWLACKRASEVRDRTRELEQAHVASGGWNLGCLFSPP